MNTHQQSKAKAAMAKWRNAHKLPSAYAQDKYKRPEWMSPAQKSTHYTAAKRLAAPSL